jgi:hypothetical protein
VSRTVAAQATEPDHCHRACSTKGLREIRHHPICNHADVLTAKVRIELLQIFE